MKKQRPHLVILLAVCLCAALCLFALRGRGTAAPGFVDEDAILSALEQAGLPGVIAEEEGYLSADGRARTVVVRRPGKTGGDSLPLPRCFSDWNRRTRCIRLSAGTGLRTARPRGPGAPSCQAPTVRCPGCPATAGPMTSRGLKSPSTPPRCGSICTRATRCIRRSRLRKEADMVPGRRSASASESTLAGMRPRDALS